MTHQQLLKRYDSLPPAARKQVDKLMAELVTSGSKTTRRRSSAQPFGPDDEVFGMWRDREDMQDAAAWVHNLRRKQWGRRIGRVAD